MKGETLQITWHDSKPVLTLDFHRPSGFLATGGADHDIKFWSLHQTESKKDVPKASYESSLAYHSSSVNVLRFSPSGEQLASGADGGELVIWKLHYAENGNSWKVLKTLSFHRKDILDLQWSPHGGFLISGSVDNSCIIWDATKGVVQQILDSHLHYVQGVAWDPVGVYVASTSSDRTCKIYINKPQHGRARVQDKMNYICQHVIAKAETQNQCLTKLHLFHDETLPSFFRRLQWSPDGSFLVVPAGVHKFSSESSASNTAYIFSRRDFSRPAVQLPGASKPIVAVRFCPLFFTLKAAESDGLVKLPYRLVFAIATLNSLYIYDTESSIPIAIFAGIHYAAITDIAWSFDARFLAVSSQDGYCTVIEFDNGELGSPASLSGIPSHAASHLPQATVEMANIPRENMVVDMSMADENFVSRNPVMEIDERVKNLQSTKLEKYEAPIEKADNLFLEASNHGSLSNGKESNCGRKTHGHMQAAANLPETCRKYITPIVVDLANSGGEKMDVDMFMAQEKVMSNDIELETEEGVKNAESTETEKSKAIKEKTDNSAMMASSNVSEEESTIYKMKQEETQQLANPPKTSRRRITPIAIEKP